MGGTSGRGKHGTVGASGGAGLQYSEHSFRDRTAGCIAEDDEAVDDESTSFAITGTSEFFRKGDICILCMYMCMYIQAENPSSQINCSVLCLY